MNPGRTGPRMGASPERPPLTLSRDPLDQGPGNHGAGVLLRPNVELGADLAGGSNEPVKEYDGHRVITGVTDREIVARPSVGGRRSGGDLTVAPSAERYSTVESVMEKTSRTGAGLSSAVSPASRITSSTRTWSLFSRTLSPPISFAASVSRNSGRPTSVGATSMISMGSVPTLVIETQPRLDLVHVPAGQRRDRGLVARVHGQLGGTEGLEVEAVAGLDFRHTLSGSKNDP